MSQRTTTPLVQGEAVYKLINELDIVYVASLYKVYTSAKEVYVHLFGNGKNLAAIQRRSDKKLYQISTSYLGYVGSTGVGGGQEKYMGKYIPNGYQITWEIIKPVTGYTLKYDNFEDEMSVISLRDIDPLNPEELQAIVAKQAKRISHDYQTLTSY